MTQEEKELLLKVLCELLPYNLHCCVFRLNGDIKENDDILYGVIGDNVVTLKSDKDECLMYYQIKPYLRPMSEMTDEERNELYELTHEGSEDWTFSHNAYVVIDWLNAHHFDYRELIEKGLALEAPERMYEIKDKNVMSWEYYPKEFSSYEEYVKYLKEKGFALEAPEGMYKTKTE